MIKKEFSAEPKPTTSKIENAPEGSKPKELPKGDRKRSKSVPSSSVNVNKMDSEARLAGDNLQEEERRETGFVDGGRA